MLRLFILLAYLMPAVSLAGGITLGSTRVIFPENSKQVNVSVRNTSEENTYLVQSWIEDKNGVKTKDFISTPPVYTSAPGNENKLRVIYTGEKKVSDRERLYYFNVKAIPSLDKNDIQNKNILVFAAITRVKFFVRPAGLTIKPDDAPAMLRFRKTQGNIEIDNPTPYYLTLTNLESNGSHLPDIMIPPYNKETLSYKGNPEDTISYNTINDYGAITASIKKKLD